MHRLTSMARRFARGLADRRGAVAVQFALLAVPMMVVTLGAVDVTRTASIKRNLQDALDAAALAAARSNAETEADLQAVGVDALAANFTAGDATITHSRFYPVESKVVAEAQVAFTPYFAAIWTEGPAELGADSEVSRTVNKIELALVLDNTGSMAGAKLATLKTAAKKLIDTLSAAAERSPEPDPVKISLAPFSMTVRVGQAYKNASWMDGAGAAPINGQIFNSNVSRYTLLDQMGVAWGGCVESRQAPYDVQETAPDPATPVTLFTPFFAPDEPDNSSSYYNDYVPDEVSGGWQYRQGYLGKYDQSPQSGTNSAGYNYGPNAGCQLQPLMRLTTDFEALKGAIDGMTAVGDTNIPMGLAWGWHTLSPNAPFADGVAYGTPKSRKIVILMTDGDNTHTYAYNNNASFYAGAGYIWQGRLGITSGTSGQRREAMDARLALLCANMKAQNILIYTVRVEVSSGSSSVMQTCASEPGMFYDVQSVTQLEAVFDSIAAAIQNLRIVK